jgi:hypothetical protein
MNDKTTAALEKYLASKPSFADMIGLLESRMYLDEEVANRVRLEMVKRSGEEGVDRASVLDAIRGASSDDLLEIMRVADKAFLAWIVEVRGEVPYDRHEVSAIRAMLERSVELDRSELRLVIRAELEDKGQVPSVFDPLVGSAGFCEEDAAFVLSRVDRLADRHGVCAPLLERMAEYVLGLGAAASNASLEAVIRSFSDLFYEGEVPEGPNPVLATPSVSAIKERATRLYLMRKDASPAVLLLARNQVDSDSACLAAGMALVKSPLITFWDLDGLGIVDERLHDALRQRIAWDFALVDELLRAIEYEDDLASEGDWEDGGEEDHESYLDDCGDGP